MIGAPERIRTSDLSLRRRLLYPAELPGHRFAGYDTAVPHHIHLWFAYASTKIGNESGRFPVRMNQLLEL